MHRLSRYARALAAAIGLSFVSHAATAADTYPNKYVSMIVAAVPGSPSDLSARLLAKGLTEHLHQSFVVQNHGGAAGNIGTGMVVRAAPDGYTLLVVATSGAAINQSLYSQLGFDPQKDLAPISLLVEVPFILAINPSVPAKNLKELITYVKSRKESVTFASAQYLAGEMFNLNSKLKMTYVGYKGSAPALTDVVAGRVPLVFDNAITLLPFIKSGQLRPIAVSSTTRLEILPDLPTFKESGTDFVTSNWFGLFAPAGTPKAIIDTLNRETRNVMKEPDWQRLLNETGAQLVDMTPEQFAAFDHAEAAKWANVIKASGTTMN